MGRYHFLAILWETKMNRRKFIIATAATTLFPSVALARRKKFQAQENNSDLPVIRMQDDVIINSDFVFENIPWKTNVSRTGNLAQFKFERTTVAWLNETDAQSYIKIDDSKGYIISDGFYWGKVLVKQLASTTRWISAYPATLQAIRRPTCWIERLPVSSTK